MHIRMRLLLVLNLLALSVLPLCLLAQSTTGTISGSVVDAQQAVIPGAMITEIAMLAIGVSLYVAATRARDRIGRYVFSAYVALLLLLYIGDRFSPPPPDVASIAWPGIVAVVILLPWAWWFDRHREPREPRCARLNPRAGIMKATPQTSLAYHERRS